MSSPVTRQRQRAIELLSLKTSIELGRHVREFDRLQNDQAQKHAILDQALHLRDRGSEFFRCRMAPGSDVDMAMLEVSHRAIQRLAVAVDQCQQRYDDATTACESKRSDVERSMARQNQLEILRDEVECLRLREADRRIEERIEERILQRGRSP